MLYGIIFFSNLLSWFLADIACSARLCRRQSGKGSSLYSAPFPSVLLRTSVLSALICIKSGAFIPMARWLADWGDEKRVALFFMFGRWKRAGCLYYRAHRRNVFGKRREERHALQFRQQVFQGHGCIWVQKFKAPLI